MSAAGPAPGGWELKVCGAVSPRELDALAEAGVTLAGVGGFPAPRATWTPSGWRRSPRTPGTPAGRGCAW